MTWAGKRKHNHAFHDLQFQLQEATRLAHRDQMQTLCLHTDASDKHQAVAATQCEPQELSKPLLDQKHHPIAFLSSSFTKRKEHWSTYEREDFAVVQAFRKLDYLLACDTTTRVFSDHRNLLFAFNIVAMKPSLGSHKVLKVVRWALYLSAFHYRIEHVSGDSHTWPDIMTRWMRGYRNAPAIRRVARAIPFGGVTPSPDSADFKWTSIADVAAAQKSNLDKAPPTAQSTGSLLLLSNGAAWIPDDANELKLRILTIYHTGRSVHRGADSSWNVLREQFYWTNQWDDVRTFVSSCVLCLFAKSGHKVPRPLCTTLHASKPNQVIHFDYLFLGESDTDKKYALVVKDDLSGYCWLEPTSSADSSHCAAVLAR